MAVVVVDIGSLVGKVPGGDDLIVVAQMLESLVRIYGVEASVEDGYADASAVEAFIDKDIALHTQQLVGDAIAPRQVGGFRSVGLAGISGGGNLHLGGNHIGAFNEGQLLDSGYLVVGCHHSNGVEPTALAHLFGGDGVDLIDVAVAERIVADVVEVGVVDAVAFDGFGIEIAVGVECCAGLVGQEDPVAGLGVGADCGNGQSDD